MFDNTNQHGYSGGTAKTNAVEIGVSNTESEKSLQAQSLAIFSRLLSSMADKLEGRKTRLLLSVQIRQSFLSAALIGVGAAVLSNTTERIYHV